MLVQAVVLFADMICCSRATKECHTLPQALHVLLYSFIGFERGLSLMAEEQFAAAHGAISEIRSPIGPKSESKVEPTEIINRVTKNGMALSWSGSSGS